MVVYEYKTTEDFDYEDFLREFNENAVTKEFLDSCKKTAKMFKKPKTNADRIRSMTDEELAELIENPVNIFHCSMCDNYNNCDCELTDCTEYILKWLKQYTDNQE